MVFQEVITVKEGIMEDFEKNVQMFATEHLHTEKEARFVIEGSGMSTHSSFFFEFLLYHCTTEGSFSVSLITSLFPEDGCFFCSHSYLILQQHEALGSTSIYFDTG